MPDAGDGRAPTRTGDRRRRAASSPARSTARARSRCRCCAPPASRRWPRWRAMVRDAESRTLADPALHRPLPARSSCPRCSALVVATFVVGLARRRRVGGRVLPLDGGPGRGQPVRAGARDPERGARRRSLAPAQRGVLVKGGARAAAARAACAPWRSTRPARSPRARPRLVDVVAAAGVDETELLAIAVARRAHERPSARRGRRARRNRRSRRRAALTARPSGRCARASPGGAWSARSTATRS